MGNIDSDFKYLTGPLISQDSGRQLSSVIPQRFRDIYNKQCTFLSPEKYKQVYEQIWIKPSHPLKEHLILIVIIK